MSTTAFNALRENVRGTVIEPDDPDYESARRVYNAMADRRPAAVLRVSQTADVIAAVRFAREAGLPLALRGGGHSAPGFGTVDDGLVLDFSGRRGVWVDPRTKRARAEAGATWGDYNHATHAFGLASTGGIVGSTGVAGLTLGGGIGYLSRKYGLACDNLVSADVVLADGTFVRASAEENEDLFWALRGGGGSFGIVTAIEIELLPIAQVYAGAMFWPQDRAREVFQAWREWTQQDQPDEIISVARVLNVPPFPEVPEFLRGRSFVVIEAVYLGEESEGAQLIAPLRALGPEIDTFSTVPAPALSHLHMDPDHPVPGKGDSLVIGEMPAELIDEFVAAATGPSGSALLSAEIRQLGGAIARPAPEHGALGSIDAPYIMFAVGAAPTEEIRAVVKAQVAGVKQAISRWGAGYEYLSFVERPIDSRELYRDEYTYRRLQAVKAQYDPADMIQSNHPIRLPAAAIALN